MPKTDERIQQMLNKRQAANEAASRASMAAADADKAKKEHDKAKKEQLKQLREKWTKDADTIDAAVKSLNEKLAPLGVTFTFLAKPGSPGISIATAEFEGRGPKGLGKMTFNVFETGDVHVYFNTQISSQGFDLTKAEQETYENVLLDFAERLS